MCEFGVSGRSSAVRAKFRMWNKLAAHLSSPAILALALLMGRHTRSCVLTPLPETDRQVPVGQTVLAPVRQRGGYQAAKGQRS